MRIVRGGYRRIRCRRSAKGWRRGGGGWCCVLGALVERLEGERGGLTETQWFGEAGISDAVELLVRDVLDGGGHCEGSSRIRIVSMWLSSSSL